MLDLGIKPNTFYRRVAEFETSLEQNKKAH